MRVRVLLPVLATAIFTAPAPSAAAFLHTVARGESLSSIAADDGLSVSQLAAANGIPADAQLTAGSTLSIPPAAGAASGEPSGLSTAASASSPATVAAGDNDGLGSAAAAPAGPVSATAGATAERYVVQPGDTLSAIAARAGLSVTQLAVANGINPSALLLAGGALSLPLTSAQAAQVMLSAARNVVGGSYNDGNHDTTGETATEVRRAGTDCSGFVSWVLEQAGIVKAAQTTQTLPSQPNLEPGTGRYVTIWDRDSGPTDNEHAVIAVLGSWFESGGTSTYNPSGGISEISRQQAEGELSEGGFSALHPTGL